MTGVSCSGKDFLLELIRPLLSITIVNFGEELFRELQFSHPELTSRDEIRAISSQDVNRAVMKVNCCLVSSQPVVVSSHIVVRVGGDLVVRPDSDEILSPQVYIHVSAPVEEILVRRGSNNRGRMELAETKKEVGFHQDLSEIITARVAQKQGSAFVRVWNQSGSEEECLQVLESTLVRFH